MTDKGVGSEQCLQCYYLDHMDGAGKNPCLVCFHDQSGPSGRPTQFLRSLTKAHAKQREQRRQLDMLGYFE